MKIIYGIMKILDIKTKLISIPLKKRFTIATGSSEYSNNVIIEIITDEETGIGEASPSLHVLGETPEHVLSTIDLFKKHLINKDPFEMNEILKKMDEIIVRNESSKAAIDFALYDLYGKITKRPVVNLIGGNRFSMMTDITIGIEDYDETVSDAINYVKMGFRALKVKVGLNPEKDYERLRGIRENVGENIQIRVDANQGFTFSQARWFLNKIKDLNIEFIEQPLPEWDLVKISELRKISSIPIMLDESVKNIRDLKRAIDEGACDLINIKLMKTGGIKRALSMADFALSNGIDFMVGCMSESPVGISAAMHFSLAAGAKYIDLDCHLLQSKNIVKQGLRTENGINYIEERPGLGVSLIENIFV